MIEKLNVKRIIICFSFLFILFIPFDLHAQVKLTAEDLKNLSFEELMNVKMDVSAAITRLVQPETPASVTVITDEDIRHTPARNILDLIEIYVPGAIWMNYEEGPQIGIRGIIANRNTKYLLKVNGRTMNIEAHFGAKTELEQWALDDIQKIEIIRGPGSVTYGPGAIAGVINIVTHDANSVQGLSVSANYLNEYDSKGLSIQNGFESEKVDVYAYSSITRTTGFLPRHFLVTKNNEAGYIGKSILPDREPMDYFADYQDDPQIKFFINADFLNSWCFWSRYTQQGSTWFGNEMKNIVNGAHINQQSIRDRQWAIALEYDKDLSETVSMSSIFSYSTSDAERRNDRMRYPDPDHVLNKQVDFSEKKTSLNGIINWYPEDRLELAAGAEYSFYSFGSGWFDDDNDMKLGENGIIVSGPFSNAILAGNEGSAERDSTEIFVGSGWNSHMYSLFSEANLEIKSGFKALLSGRMDKNTYSDWLFSPRIALITNIFNDHYAKLIVQRSVRMNTAGQLYTDDFNGNEYGTETLKGLELIYSAYIGDDLLLNLSCFRNNIDIIAWDDEINASNPVGRLKLYGIEGEYKQTLPFGNIGASYSFVKQLDWKLEEGVFRSSISYSDYNQPVGDGIQTGYGNDLANWPNQAFKLFGRFSLLNRITFHIDSRILWDFQGSKDGLTGLSNAVAGTADEAAVSNSINEVNNVNTYENDFRSNFSLSYLLNENFEMQFYGLNVFGANKNKRYSYDYGNDKTAPAGVRFVEEPRVWGLKLNYRIK
ncbi:TonB-dependent receptor plug domain-containing protein [candidate division KSB1 bacterium]